MDDLITKLNNQIAEIDTDNIEAHIKNGDLDSWLVGWRIEIAAISFALFVMMESRKK